MGLSGEDWNGTEWKNDGGMLGGAFRLKSGQISRRRLKGQEAIVLAPGSVLEYTSPVLTSTQAHTATVWMYDNNAWTSVNADRYLTNGGIRIEAGNKPLILTNFRYYNWQQEEAEKQYDATTGLVRIQPSDRHKRGLLVSLSANDFAVGDTVAYIPNKGIEGVFEAQNTPAIVKEIGGKKAFCFEGKQVFRSSFPLPATLADNAPYTLDARILNPELSEND